MKKNQKYSCTFDKKITAVIVALILTTGMTIPVQCTTTQTSVDSHTTGQSSSLASNAAQTNVNEAAVSDNGNIALGENAKATGIASIALGKNAEATGGSSFASGMDAKASSAFSVAIGLEAQANGISANAIGSQTIASGKGSFSAGFCATSTSDYSVAVGQESKAESNGAVALGYKAIASGKDSLAFGENTNAVDADSIAMGNNSVTDSVSNTNTTRVSITDNNKTKAYDLGTTGQTAYGVFSLGDKSQGIYRQIKNVANGEVSATSTDAVNGEQLYGVARDAMTAASVSASVSANAALYDNATKNTLTLQGASGMTTIDKVAPGILSASSLQAVNGSQIQAITSKYRGYFTRISDYLSHFSGFGWIWNPIDDDSNALIHKTMQASKAIVARTGTNALRYGIDATDYGDNSTVIGNAAHADVDNTVAVGYGSVSAAAHMGAAAQNLTLGSMTVPYAGLASDTNGTVSFGSPGKERQLQYVAAGDISGTSTDAVNGSQLYATNANLSALQTSLSNVTGLAPTFNSVTLGSGASQIIMNGSGVSIGGHTYITNNGINANNQKITNVQNGTVSASSTDAINGSQLYSYMQSQGNTATNANAVKTRLKRSAALLSMGSEAADAADSNSNSNAAALMANSSQSAAADSTVDSSQLYAVQEKVTAAEDAIGTLNTGMSKLTSDMNNLSTRVDKVGTGAAALASLHPLDYDPDNKFDVAAGLGHYSGETAGAVGAFYRPNEDTIISMGAEIGNGENMWNAGLTFKVGSGNGSKAITSRTVMAKKIVGLEAEVQELKEQAKTQDLKQQTEKQEWQQQIGALKQQIEILMQKNK